MVFCLKDGVIFTRNGNNQMESSIFDKHFDMSSYYTSINKYLAVDVNNIIVNLHKRIENSAWWLSSYLPSNLT